MLVKSIPKLPKIEKIVFKWYAYGIFISSLIGFVFGCFRYWFGFFVLIQGMIAGFFIPKITSLFVKESASNRIKTSKVVFVMFVFFILFQVVGFGVAQPWFDPVGWLSRVMSGSTYEDIFGLALMGNAIGKQIIMGANKGFWAFLNLFDIVFMYFFMIVSMNSQLKENF